MAITLTRTFRVQSTKFLFSNFFKTRCNRKMLNNDYRTLVYKTDIFKMHWSFTNFRTLCVSSPSEEDIKKVTITFVRHDGVKFEKVVPVGTSINTIFDMDGKEIPDFGVCLGIQSCGTCHVKFSKYLINKLEKPKERELDMVICANEYDELYSRLGCCVEVTEEMDGEVILVPKILQPQQK